MKKSVVLSSLALVLITLVIGLASASYSNYDPTYSSYDSYSPVYSNNYVPSYFAAYPTFTASSNNQFNSNSAYLNRAPIYTIANLASNKYASSNFDSSNYNSNSVGPTARMNVQYNEYLLVKPNGKVIRTVSYSDTSAYLGAAQAVSSNLQNRQMASSDASSSSQTNYNGGFTTAANSQSASSNANQAYSFSTFQPTFSDGYYHWNY